jgi:hypothetical protein
VTSQCRPTLAFHVEVGATREPRREQQRLGTVGSEQRHGAAALGGDERRQCGSGASRGFDLEHEW